MKVYLDNGATTKVDNEVAKVMQKILVTNYGNPSSLHQFGRTVKDIIENSREVIAQQINANPDEIIFTSGGTEADNLAVFGILKARKGKNHIITSSIEHPGILKTCKYLETEGYKVTYLKTNKEGFVSLDELKKSITSNTALVSIMHANNEIGTIEPIEKIAKICEKNKIPFHIDAVQSFKKVPIDVKKINISALSLSAHKIHGPKGVGALYLKKGTPFRKIPYAGGPEKKKRAGTENVAGIVGFAKAVELKIDTLAIKKLQDYLIKKILKEIPDTGLNGPKDKRLCNNANIYFRFIEGESLLMHLDLKGIAVSTGSACSSLDLEISHVLQAINLPHELAHGSIRFTLSKYTTKEEIDYTIKHLKKIVENLRRISPLTK